MSRLQKFAEIGANGDGPRRIAYALDLTQLPALEQGSEWRLVENFKPGDEILRDARLADVFKAAISDGYAIVTPRA